uniref:Uncharacterized protein n=1 Tax=Meloidogyne enterolobii TaxID=390850 RepID=A0A6V7YCG2_MELEN|nr:unnamed protein product [Meloidogyne enterolobii]
MHKDFSPAQNQLGGRKPPTLIAWKAIAPVGWQALGQQRFNTYNERKNRIGAGNNVPMLRNRASAMILILESLISTMKKITDGEYNGIKGKDLNTLRTEAITFMTATMVYN